LYIRFLRLDSPIPYFVTGKNAKGLCTTTDVLEVKSEEDAFLPLELLIQVFFNPLEGTVASQLDFLSEYQLPPAYNVGYIGYILLNTSFKLMPCRGYIHASLHSFVQAEDCGIACCSRKCQQSDDRVHRMQCSGK
jgi:hypothetical protein